MGTRKNFAKALEGMQSALEQETKAKTESLTMKKKLEADVTELNIALEQVNFANIDTQKTIKKYQQQIRDTQIKLVEEQRHTATKRDLLVSAQRKAHSAKNELEEARTLLEQTDKARRTAEQELSDTNEQLSDMTCTNQAIAGAKSKLESETQTLHVRLHYFNL